MKTFSKKSLKQIKELLKMYEAQESADYEYLQEFPVGTEEYENYLIILNELSKKTEALRKTIEIIRGIYGTEIS